MMRSSNLGVWWCAVVVVAGLLALVSSDIDQDKTECADKVVGLATCLAYVGGEAKAPTPDCCSGLKLVLTNSKKCLCVLIKDRNDPTLGLKVNLTLALGLPNACHSPADVKDCVGLLHLPPNSPEAKDFLASNAKGPNSTTPASAVSSNSTQNGEPKNDGGMIKQTGFLWFFTSSLLFTYIS